LANKLYLVSKKVRLAELVCGKDLSYFGLKTSYMLPSLQLLEKVSKEIKSIPNRRGEHLRQVHYGCYLLCHKSGLRISEAVSFDLENKTKEGLYRIKRPKGKKERLVYIPKKVIRELKKHN